MPEEDPFTTVAAAARLLGCDVRTIHRLIGRGELPAIKAHEGLRAPYLLRTSDVDALVAKRVAA